MSSQLITDLKQALRSKLQTGAAINDSIRKGVWNGAASTQTFALVECHSTSDVATAVRIAKEYSVPVSPLGGGHDWTGRSVCSDGITLDLRKMRGAVFNPDRDTITIQGGTLVGDALDQLPNNRAMVVGVHRAVGLTGLALGGGYGKLNARYGLVTDTLVRAEMVLANGENIIASTDENPEIFWALKGAGKNFGIVTASEYKTFHLESVLSAKVFYLIPEASAGLKALQDALDEEVEYLSIFAIFSAGPDQEIGLTLELLWTGSEPEGARFIRMLTEKGGGRLVEKKTVRYREIFDKSDDDEKKGESGFKMDACHLGYLDDNLIDTIVKAAAAMPTSTSCLMLHDFHGAASRITSDATAFPLRRNHYNLHLVGGWELDNHVQQTLAAQWVETTLAAVEPLSLHTGYPSVLGPDSEEKSSRFYRAASDRLRKIKYSYDPTNMFNSKYGIF